ncbi:hypothetical protein CERSUDRAFT_78637 [Gelatoporia subvermispora B]|uniref:Uncharacterized protein n=1 Tax=Ceriporiopsis subvermispora (strain B) TaxID=914234 RepID=M2QXU1_CERS8|nr:hypothetical protein CERSUDRAFT_78637 [Gelatoporia subvermispora B]
MLHNNNLFRRGADQVILRDTAGRLDYSYVYAQLRDFHAFDRRLRDGRFNPDHHPYPAGYERFVQLWNQDEDCPFGFMGFEEASVSLIATPRPAPSLNNLAPTPAAPAANAAAPQFAPEDQEVYQGALIVTAEQAIRKRRFEKKCKAARVDRRAQRKQEKRELVAPRRDYPRSHSSYSSRSNGPANSPSGSRSTSPPGRRGRSPSSSRKATRPSTPELSDKDAEGEPDNTEDTPMLEAGVAASEGTGSAGGGDNTSGNVSA